MLARAVAGAKARGTLERQPAGNRIYHRVMTIRQGKGGTQLQLTEILT